MPEVSVDAEAIPDELQERDQWLFWNAGSDKPRKPLASPTADRGASWTDPDEWHSFEEAVAAAQDVESAGIGYVFAGGNDDYPRGLYGALDIDGCADSDGRPKDWLPSLQPFFDADAYMEFSPSGEGIHIPLVGFEPPDWWRDVHFTADEHEGVEAYDKKFFTFTGDTLRNCGDEVADTGEYVEDWLIEAHKSITGDDPTSEYAEEFDDAVDGGRANRDEFLDEEDIRDALDHIDPDVDYNLWRDIGFALKESFGSSNTALRVFEDWSRGGRKWDRDAEDQAERIIKDASASGGRTIATVIHHARQGGWEMPTPSGRSQGPTSSAEIDTDEVDRGEAILESQTAPEDPVGDLVCDNGGYGIPWEYRDDDGNITDSGVDSVCNFTLETLSFLSIEDQDHDEFVARVHPNHPTEGSYDVRIPPAVFNSGDTFRNEVVTGRTTWFDPTNREKVPTTTILRHLRETVGAQPAPHRTGQPYLGLSEDGEEFVTPVGSLTADGWSDDPDYEYYSIGGDNSDIGPFGQKWVLSPDADDDVDEETVARICELLPNTRKTERGLPILGWFYAAPIKAHIHSWENEFPLLAPHGDTGTGKTSTLETFMQAFGGSGEPLSSTDTRFTKEKHLAESRGFPVWIDEYKPTEMAANVRDHLHQRLKEVTKERTMPKGRPDLGMDQLHMRAPVILSGEQKIGDAAVRRRSILTNLSREPTQDGSTAKKAFGELTGVAYEEDGEQHYPDGYDLSEHARAYYSWVLSKDEATLRGWWNEARETVKDYLEDFGVGLQPSEQRGLQTVIFGVEMSRRFATDFDANESKLPSESDVRDACAHVIQNIGKEGQRREHADEFLEALSLAATDGYVEPDVHHRVFESSKHETEVLAVHMPSTFSAVKRYVRDSNLEDEYTLLSKTDYDNSFGNKADVADSYVIGTNKRTRALENGGRAVHFDHEAITEKLGSDFNINSFRPEEERVEDTDGADATPINDLSDDGNPYDTVTVEVTRWEAGPDGGPAESGTFRDETGIIDVVDFFGCEASGAFGEGETFRVENARVSTYEGTLQLEIVQNTTEVTPIQEGAGHTPSGDSGDGDSPADAGSQSSLDAAADGGSVTETDIVSLKPRIVKFVRENEHEYSPGVPKEIVVENFAANERDPESVSEAISEALRDGAIAEPKSGHLRSV